MSENNNEDDKEKKIDYFDMSDAVDDVSYASETKDKAIAGAKLFGKALFNVGLFAAKAGVEIAKELPHTVARQAEKTLETRSDLSDEQREKLQQAVDRSKEIRQKEAEEERNRRSE